MTITPIAHFHSPFTEKFGIPRQSGPIEELAGQIVFEPEWRTADALRGIEDFDYLWLLWEFSANRRARKSPTVRPPLLGGNQRMGVFATRSPFRPNNLGLSCVRLDHVEWQSPQGPVIHVLGADLMDQTPIYDIKPYLPYADSHPDARGGFTDRQAWPRLNVTMSDQCAAMFTPEQLGAMSVEEIEDTMNRLLAHDDYMWNRKAHVAFDGKGQMAKKLDTLLYLCPKCGAKYEMDCAGNTMTCRKCGNSVELDEFYQLHPVGDSVCPELVTDWTILERERAAEEVRKPDFCHSGHVRVGVLPEHKALTGDATSLIRGEGTLTLDCGGLHFDGVLEGAPFRFTIASAQLPTYGMCTDISRFYTFVDGRFLEFYPDAGDVLLWDHLTEELHRFQGGKWQNTPYRHRED